MRLILNIGLDPKATASIAARVAREILGANGFLVASSRVVPSATEPTLVVEVVWTHRAPAAGAIAQTAIDLGQDCIAVWSAQLGVGLLLGPRTAPYGGFKQYLFFMPNGQRLQASPITPAAMAA